MTRVIDFETTGMPPEASVCEAAFVDVDFGSPQYWHTWQSLVRPTTPMDLMAMATHHITEAEAIAGIEWDKAKSALQMYGDGTFAAHNADFERAFFDPEGVRWIDTWKVALRLWPDAPSHSNQVLRYYLNLDVGERGMPPHRALPDAWVTAHILRQALEEVGEMTMEQWSAEPPYLTRIPFGKHRGEKFSDAPRDYLEWITRQDMEPGVIAAAKRELAK